MSLTIYSSATAPDAVRRDALRTIWVAITGFDEPGMGPHDYIDLAISCAGMRHVPYLTAVDGGRGFVGVQLRGFSRIETRRAHSALAAILTGEPAQQPVACEDQRSGCADELPGHYTDPLWPHLIPWQPAWDRAFFSGDKDNPHPEIGVDELVRRAGLMESAATDQHPAWWLLHVLCNVRGMRKHDAGDALAQCDSPMARFAAALLYLGAFEFAK